MSTEEYNALCSDPVVDPDPAAPIPYRPHLEDITETEDIHGAIASTRPTAEKLKSKVEKDHYVDVAIVLRRRLTVDRRAEWIQLELQAPAITEAVTKVCGNSFFLNTKVSPIIIRKPYLVLFHYREGLREYAKHDDRTEEEKTQLKVLIDFMAKESQRVETDYNRLVSKGQVTFPLVWALFEPGEEVFVHDSHYVT
jgi:hypothetical protein